MFSRRARRRRPASALRRRLNIIHRWGAARPLPPSRLQIRLRSHVAARGRLTCGQMRIAINLGLNAAILATPLDGSIERCSFIVMALHCHQVPNWCTRTAMCGSVADMSRC